MAVPWGAALAQAVWEVTARMGGKAVEH
jgi:hypothetical protein